MRRLDGAAEVERALGEELGVGSWYPVTQAAVTAFADVTGDHQWIHVDAARAAQGPYGGTVAHGYFTLSLLPHLVSDAFELTGFGMKVNYGLDRVRFPSPVRVGSRIRARAVLTEVEGTARGTRIVVRNTVEIEDSTVPACVADTVALLVPRP
ncbi:MaoC family dehydratase [Glycomyces tenuis]|uniref:MaoC family dehydratase n=1 Tax=Glycomyces tenuis TaxID=58116 RepID=UPI0003F60A5D|nr:MaoC family dehydratase [Glycomyces tenuis]